MTTLEKQTVGPEKLVRNIATVPMLTPFTREGKLDERSVGRLIKHILDGGCQGILASGTTGEAASMSVRMRIQLARISAQAMDSRGTLFFGIGSDSLDHSVELGKEAIEAGVDVLVAHLPTYYSITERDMEKWFIELVDRVDAPLFLYNIPQTTGLSIPCATIKRLSRHPRIIGMKDSEPNEGRQRVLSGLFEGKAEFAYHCGTMKFAGVAMRSGASGYTPSIGNLLPSLVRSSMDACLSDDQIIFERELGRIESLSSALMNERTLGANISALKAAASTLSLCDPHMLPPLLEAKESKMDAIRTAMKSAEATS